jgi:hypothetical protein
MPYREDSSAQIKTALKAAFTSIPPIAIAAVHKAKMPRSDICEGRAITLGPGLEAGAAVITASIYAYSPE